MLNRVASFYQFRRVHDPASLAAGLRELCESLGLAGSVLISAEGINGTLAGRPEQIERAVEVLQQGNCHITAFGPLEVRFSVAGERHFDRLKIKIKPEIVTFGHAKANPLVYAATKVAPLEWNQLVSDSDTLLLDTRNKFEVKMGSFAGAIDPEITKFSDFAAFVDHHLDPEKHRKIAMFCTGGIRCEKAGAYMLAAGFAEVFMLQGGILKYLEDIPPKNSVWRGDCFVFDQRVALRHGLEIAEELAGYCP